MLQVLQTYSVFIFSVDKCNSRISKENGKLQNIMMLAFMDQNNGDYTNQNGSFEEPI